MMKVLLLFFLVSCGHSVVMKSKGYRAPVKLAESNNYHSMELKLKTKVHNIFGKFGPGHKEVGRELIQETGRELPLKNFTIHTYYTTWDVLLNLIPFYQRRTVEVRADYDR